MTQREVITKKKLYLEWRNDKLNNSGLELKTLLRGVPRDLMKRVYNRYKLDYELFNYDFNATLKIADHDPLTEMEEETAKRVMADEIGYGLNPFADLKI